MPFVDREALVGSLLAKCSPERKQLYATLGDLVAPVHEWPEWAIRLLFKPRLGNNDRYSLVMFTLGNGMPPDTLAKWCLSQRGVLYYDTSALSLAEMIRKHGLGGLDYKETWNVGAHMEMPVLAPTFAFDHTPMRVPILSDECKVTGFAYAAAGSSFWQDAVHRLEEAARMLPREKDNQYFARNKEAPLRQ